MFATVAVLAIAFCNLALGLIVLLKNRRNFTNVSFSVFAITLAVWLVATYFSNDVSLSRNILLQLTRFSLFVPNLALYFLLLFSLEFTGYIKRYFVPFAWVSGLSALVVSLISTTPLLIAGLEPQQDVVILKFGPFAPIFTFFIIGQFLAVIFILLSSVHRLRGSARARVQYMAISLFLALSILVTTSLIMPLIFRNYDYGNAEIGRASCRERV